MSLALTVIQAASAIFLTVLVLMQSKGTGLGRSFGGSSYHSRRGVEHLLFRLTIVLATVFSLSSLAQLFI